MKAPHAILALALASAPAAAHAATTTLFLQAESAATSVSCGAGWKTAGAGATGSGYSNCNDDTTAFIQWSVRQPAAGTRRLSFRYASPNARTAELTVNGVARSLAFVAAPAWSCSSCLPRSAWAWPSPAITTGRWPRAPSTA
jgi:hypothetical protein